jgi:hypothetical protein
VYSAVIPYEVTSKQGLALKQLSMFFKIIKLLEFSMPFRHQVDFFMPNVNKNRGFLLQTSAPTVALTKLFILCHLVLTAISSDVWSIATHLLFP